MPDKPPRQDPGPPLFPDTEAKEAQPLLGPGDSAWLFADSPEEREEAELPNVPHRSLLQASDSPASVQGRCLGGSIRAYSPAGPLRVLPTQSKPTHLSLRESIAYCFMVGQPW